MSAPDWRLDTDRWPGPDRARWGISRDVVVPSPDGRFACVLYSCTEIRLGCEVGLLTVLEGPPTSPSVILQPPNFTCLDFTPRRSAQWLEGGRFAVVTPYLNRPTSNRVDLLALTFLDTVNRAFAHHEIGLAQAGQWFVEKDGLWELTVAPGHELQGMTLSPETLQWKLWTLLG